MKSWTFLQGQQAVRPGGLNGTSQLVSLPGGQQAILRCATPAQLGPQSMMQLGGQPMIQLGGQAMMQLGHAPVQQQYMQVQVPMSTASGATVYQTVQIPVQMQPQQQQVGIFFGVKERGQKNHDIFFMMDMNEKYLGYQDYKRNDFRQFRCLFI